MTAGQTQDYDEALVALLEMVWGEGYMSPGGPEEIRAIVEEVPLAGKEMLDLGCGTGGITDFLDHEIEVWRALTVVVDSGELRPGHLRAVKPG